MKSIYGILLSSLLWFLFSGDDENKLPSKGSSSSLPFAKERNRENERDPSKWTQSRIGKKSHAVPLDKISTKPGFDIHQDEGMCLKSIFYKKIHT